MAGGTNQGMWTVKVALRGGGIVAQVDMQNRADRYVHAVARAARDDMTACGYDGAGDVHTVKHLARASERMDVDLARWFAPLPAAH